MDRKEYHKERKQSQKATHKRVELQLTLKEYKDFCKIADREGLSPNKVILNMAVAYKNDKYYLPSGIQESLNDLSKLIRNIANNLNQMSHSANVFGEVDRNSVFAHLKQLDQNVADFVKKKLK